jgi:pyruvate formate lyase activating enzyme
MATPKTAAKGPQLALTGIIFDLKRYAIHDGPGIRTTVFFKGCPLNCQWCHNPESRKPGIERLPVSNSAIQDPFCPRETTVGCEVTVETIMAEILQDRVFYDESGGGVTSSGGEPLLQAEFLLALLDACRREGIHTAVDTSGYAPPADIERVCHAADLLLYDLKLMDDTLHRQYVGVSNALILSNLKVIADSDCRIVARLPLIPDVTDSDENLLSVADFLGPLNLRQISLLAYNKLGEDKHERYGLRGHHPQMKVQDREILLRKAGLLEARGFVVTVGG